MTTADATWDPAAPLTPTGNLRRRLIVDRLAVGAATAASTAAVAVLAFLVYSVGHKGASQLSIGFLTKNPPPFPGPGGGVAPAIVGTAVVVALATVIATPLGVLIALYLTEFARGSRLAGLIRTTLDLMNGLPSIVIAVFVFGLVVAGRGQSGYAASIALAIIMLPLVARSSQEVLLLVPGQLREAADALGVRRWRAVVGVILPSAAGGILTGMLLAVARAAGETAPIIILCSLVRPGIHTNPFNVGTGLDTITGSIFIASQQADPYSQARAWGAAFVLLAFILVTSVGARALLNRNRRRLSG